MKQRMFTIYPAIDLRGGRCVRLLHGKAEHETVYFEDPLEAAEKWIAEGAEWLHVVDLDGAFTGKPAHLEVISRIAALGCKIQVGGGIRNEEIVESTLAAGASRVVLGTSAVEKPEFPANAVSRFGSQSIAVGLDAKDGKLALRGWVKGTEINTLDFARKMEDVGVETVIHTDIATDGALTGPNLLSQAELADSCGLSVITSGGVSSQADVEALAKLSQDHANIAGVIVGRALYEGRVSVREMIESTKPGK
ncbi:1-(5-phosphoribosyl)-5-[(5-phosphoribosylamino)methylideneamino]imidazole-4-carboxamide isomerase [Puniceicoccus vermicola]|nr:1-(5-phosphoribosyl)-5-[(5-phosphoribosylamino)methylideneamino]imidazole-4-carboxamide isomerase [Puniceicoccus vermicola]